jgi:hypothetical protein
MPSCRVLLPNLYGRNVLIDGAWRRCSRCRAHEHESGESKRCTRHGSQITPSTGGRSGRLGVVTAQHPPYRQGSHEQDGDDERNNPNGPRRAEGAVPRFLVLARPEHEPPEPHEEYRYGGHDDGDAVVTERTEIRLRTDAARSEPRRAASGMERHRIDDFVC